MATLTEMFHIKDNPKRKEVDRRGTIPHSNKRETALKRRNPTYVMVGDSMTEARLKRQMTQKALAEKMGITSMLVSRIENGHSNITLKTLQRIADALDMDLEIHFKPKHE